jgi:hypothetical protein
MSHTHDSPRDRGSSPKGTSEASAERARLVEEALDDDLDGFPDGADELFERAPEPGSDEARKAGGVADMLRKAMVASLGAVFMTEEGIRTLVKDLKLPKDVMRFVLGQAERSKDELLRIIGEEVRRFLESAALRREVMRLVSEMTLEIKAEVRLRPEGEGGALAPVVKVAEVTARRRRRKG